MGEVTAYRKKHWVVALDADLASIPSPVIGDSALTEDKNKLYYKTAAGWKTGLGYEYVPRDAPAWDKAVGDFVFDGTWKIDGLDLSGIVPAGAKAIHIVAQIRDDAAGKSFGLQQNTVNIINGFSIYTQVANIYDGPNHAIVQCDADRKFDYIGQAGINSFNLAVNGWFI